MAKNSTRDNFSLPKDTKIAIFYDWLNQWGGAEQVLLDIIHLYPNADIFTLVHDKKNTSWLPKNLNIKTSFINNLPFSKNNPIIYTPLYLLALRLFKFNKYNIVISTTSTVGHYLKVPKKSLFVCYFHNINRYLYNTPSQFNFLNPLLNLYKTIDKKYSKNPNLIICNSNTVKDRILNNYNIKAQVINPAIDTDFFTLNTKPRKNYFLVISRLVRHKKIDIAINACKKLKKELVIIGQGRDKNYYEKISDKKFVKFTGILSPNDLKNYIQNSQALICPQLEDFGISPLEANSCGTPVIAFNKGGIKESITNKVHGILFNYQTTSSLIKAIKKFKNTSFNKNTLNTNAKKYSKNNFYKLFNQQIVKSWMKLLINK